jgi:hypothetical protein
MLPPDTDDMVVSFGRIPNSFSLRIAPKWKSVARKPPPDRLSPTEFGIFVAEGRKFATGIWIILYQTRPIALVKKVVDQVDRS